MESNKGVEFKDKNDKKDKKQNIVKKRKITKILRGMKPTKETGLKAGKSKHPEHYIKAHSPSSYHSLGMPAVPYSGTPNPILEAPSLSNNLN